jgi:hypothetical protein
MHSGLFAVPHWSRHEPHEPSPAAAGTQDTVQPFNDLVYGIAFGDFSVGATFQGKTGCLSGHVTPAP